MDADFFNRRLKRYKNREVQQIGVILERPDIFVSIELKLQIYWLASHDNSNWL